jgi:hypothetical protein
VISLARQIAGSHLFQNFILIVILLTAAIVGLETSATLTARYGPVFDGVEVLVQTIFILEALRPVHRREANSGRV